MKIKVGDKVKFLNDTGSGEVTRIVDQKTALVQVEGGFEVPWMIRDLVVDAGMYTKEEFEEEEQESEEKVKYFSEQVEDSTVETPQEDEELMLAFLPDEQSADFGVYLVNSSSYHFKYTIARQQEGEMVLFSEDSIEPGIKINLGSYRPGNVTDEEYFRIQGLFFNAGFYHHLPPLDALVRISADELYDGSNRKESDYFLEKVVSYSLYDWRKPTAPPEIEFDADELKNAMFTKGDVKPEKKPKPPGIEEVDLHIGNLTDNDPSGLESSEILDIQISRFRTALESAIIHKTGKIVFIHGVGNGRLKHKIRNILDTEYKSLRYQDASFKEYGYGATMVMVK